ncbi:MAG TPA: hypothetical protein VKU80_17170 [Planctomycetota bacterium]|nr:hypothetical protein [Planctomycetota bacterium]
MRAKSDLGSYVSAAVYMEADESYSTLVHVGEARGGEPSGHLHVGHTGFDIWSYDPTALRQLGFALCGLADTLEKKKQEWQKELAEKTKEEFRKLGEEPAREA